MDTHRRGHRRVEACVVAKPCEFGGLRGVEDQNLQPLPEQLSNVDVWTHAASGKRQAGEAEAEAEAEDGVSRGAGDGACPSGEERDKQWTTAARCHDDNDRVDREGLEPPTPAM